uniref:Uncharacterized protein n=1 Tax=Nothoprocta perdicaria TaxID=30464 RepID=A0A8C6ZND5_NOTPE
MASFFEQLLRQLQSVNAQPCSKSASNDSLSKLVILQLTSGEKGNIGSRGIPGFPGKHGLPGLPGDHGDTGLMGFPGPRGFPGPKGFQGIMGFQGQPATSLLTLKHKAQSIYFVLTHWTFPLRKEHQSHNMKSQFLRNCRQCQGRVKRTFISNEIHPTLTGEKGDPTVLLGTRGQKGPPGDPGLPGTSALLRRGLDRTGHKHISSSFAGVWEGLGRSSASYLLSCLFDCYKPRGWRGITMK